LEIFPYLDVVSLGSVAVETLSRLVIRHVEEGFEGDLTFSNKVHLGKGLLGVLGQRFVELGVLVLSDFSRPGIF
jgi:hypothetical protein